MVNDIFIAVDVCASLSEWRESVTINANRMKLDPVPSRIHNCSSEAFSVHKEKAGAFIYLGQGTP